MSTPPDYRYLFVDPASGEAICEAPMTGVTFNRMMNGVGSLQGHFPAEANFANSSVFPVPGAPREITVLRNDFARWNGVVTTMTGSRLGGWDLTALEASHWLEKRTIETDLTYTTEDIFQIVRDLVTYATSKTANGSDGMTAGASLNASLPRFYVTSGSAGVTKSYTFSGTAGHTIFEALADALVADQSTGLDWCMDYVTGSVRQSCSRTLKLGSPSLGTTHTRKIRESLLHDYGVTWDFDGAANRVTVLGSGYIKRLENTGSTTTRTEPLMERVFDRGDITDHGVIDAYATEARRVCQPPIRDFWVEFVPGPTLTFDTFDLGDTVPVDVSTAWEASIYGGGGYGVGGYSTPDPNILSINDSRRIVQIDVTPPEGGAPEIVKLTFNLAMDQLGA